VQCLGRTWEVQVVPDLTEVEGVYGDCDSRRQLVRIAQDQTHQDAQDTLLHEFVHAIDHTRGYGFTEEQVTGLSTDLIALFRANPKFIAYILK